MADARYHRIYEVVRQIPFGCVATYGQVAEVVGEPLSARDVGNAMAALRDGYSGPPVPWQRVINAQGKVSTGQHQQDLLETEGVRFNVKGAVDLQRFGWRGPDSEWALSRGFSLLVDKRVDAQQLDLF